MGRIATLADGQLPATVGTILAATATSGCGPCALTCGNSGSTTETVIITLQRAGGTGRQIAHATLAAGETLVVGLQLDGGDTLQGVTTHATTVDYMLSVSTGAVGVQVLDANGSLKTVATGISGAQTVSGKQTAKQLACSPQPTDTFGATMTLDVTYGTHIISASHTTSATVTYTPSAAGSAGDLLTVITEADSSGTVTATFASTFHPSGTQATTASTFSSIVFQSDGTRWVEVCRTTALS